MQNLIGKIKTVKMYNVQCTYLEENRGVQQRIACELSIFNICMLLVSAVPGFHKMYITIIWIYVPY
jgi:hypothetical protein